MECCPSHLLHHSNGHTHRYYVASNVVLSAVDVEATVSDDDNNNNFVVDYDAVTASHDADGNP